MRNNKLAGNKEDPEADLTTCAEEDCNNIGTIPDSGIFYCEKHQAMCSKCEFRFRKSDLQEVNPIIGGQERKWEVCDRCFEDHYFYCETCKKYRHEDCLIELEFLRRNDYDNGDYCNECGALPESLYNEIFIREARDLSKRKARREERKAKLIAFLGGKCKKCKSTKNLQFDHIDKKKKLFDISYAIDTNYDRLIEEVKKCQLLCADCHREKTKEAWDYAVEPGRHGTLHFYRNKACRCDECKKAARKYYILKIKNAAFDLHQTVLNIHHGINQEISAGIRSINRMMAQKKHSNGLEILDKGFSELSIMNNKLETENPVTVSQEMLKYIYSLKFYTLPGNAGTGYDPLTRERGMASPASYLDRVEVHVKKIHELSDKSANKPAIITNVS